MDDIPVAGAPERVAPGGLLRLLGLGFRDRLHRGLLRGLRDRLLDRLRHLGRCLRDALLVGLLQSADVRRLERFGGHCFERLRR